MIDAAISQSICEATERVANAENELMMAMEATALPSLDADDVFIGERLRRALSELGLARRALSLVLDRSP